MTTRAACVVLVLAIAVAAPPAAASGSNVGQSCRSADLRYPFEKGGPKTFGVFRLRMDGGSCTTAHRVAKEWMRRFERGLRRRGAVRLPRSVGGFAFQTLRPHAAQTYTERGRRAGTTIRFDYVVPNG